MANPTPRGYSNPERPHALGTVVLACRSAVTLTVPAWEASGFVLALADHQRSSSCRCSRGRFNSSRRSQSPLGPTIPRPPPQTTPSARRLCGDGRGPNLTRWGCTSLKRGPPAAAVKPSAWRHGCGSGNEAAMRPRTITDIDWQLYTCSERIAAYRRAGDERSAEIERGVCDRLLDERRDLTRV